jgi:hypothetical protein
MIEKMAREGETPDGDALGFLVELKRAELSKK